MDRLEEVVISTFINVHLFWIIPTKNLLIRTSINRYLKAGESHVIKNPKKNDMVAVNVDNMWARAIVEKVEQGSINTNAFICWLPDYGVMRLVNLVFSIPENVKKCPHLARQASLHNVVNLMTDLRFDGSAYEFKLTKTLSDVLGVKKVAIDCIEQAKQCFFSMADEDEFNIYGDLIFINEKNQRHSLTDYLIKKKLLAVDKNMFLSIDVMRTHHKNVYYEPSSSLRQELDKTEKKYLSEILFNKEVNKNLPPMEFFKRLPSNNDILNRFS